MYDVCLAETVTMNHLLSTVKYASKHLSKSTVAHITQIEVMNSSFFEMLINDFLNQHRLLGIF